MRITYELLKKHGACREQRNEFRKIFPKGCYPTVENLTFLANHEYEQEEARERHPWQTLKTLDAMWLDTLLVDEDFYALDRWYNDNYTCILDEDGRAADREMYIAGLSQVLMSR